MADSDPLQALTAALQACGPDPPTSPAAARAALGAADAAAQGLLRLAADPAQHAAALDSVLRATMPWAQALVRRLDRWEAALGQQPSGPEKAALQLPFRGFAFFGASPPPPGARRQAGATAGTERCAARLQAAAVLTLLDAALACQQARLPPQAAERGARDVPAEPSALEEAAYQCLKRLEDTGLPYPVRPAAGSDAAQAGQATAAGIHALGSCCSALIRLLRLASRRDHAQPEEQPPGSSAGVAAAGEQPCDSGAAAAAAADDAAEGSSGSGLEAVLEGLGGCGGPGSLLYQVQAKCRPVQPHTVMDVVFDASAVLSYWAPRPGKMPGRAHQVAWDACIALIEYLWGYHEAPRVVDGELLGYATAQRYGSRFSRYIALCPVLAYHAALCDRAAALRSAPPAELAAWATAMHRVLSILTEPFLSGVRGIAAGGCVGGPAAAFGSRGRCEMLSRSAAVLRFLPALAAAAAGAAADSEVAGSSTAAGSSTTAGPALSTASRPEVLDTEQQVLEVGQMLVQLLASSCSSFDAETCETSSKEQRWVGTSLPHIRRANAALGLELLPALVAPPLAVLSASGPNLEAAARLKLYACSGSWATAEAREAAVHKWIEWRMALDHLSGLAWSLGEEVEAGAAGSQFGSGSCRIDGASRHIPFVTADGAALAAEEAAKLEGAWPPRDPATLAAAAAAAQHLLSRWHAIRAAVLPSPPAAGASADIGSNSRQCSIGLRMQQRLPHTCRQLVAAAAAALQGSSPAQLQAALMPLFDAAGTACKLVLLASSDADHRVLLGIAQAAPANDAPFCPPCRPYRPIDLMLTACQAAADCVQHLAVQPSALPPEQQEYARRRTCALLLQLCAAAEAAAAAGEPLASQIQAAWNGSGHNTRLPRLLGTLLQACGGVHSSAANELGGSLVQGVAEARALAGSAMQQHLALATLPCANAACMAAGAGGSEAALPGRRCSGCNTARYSSALCQQASWKGGHRQACCGLAAAAADAPPAVPPPYGGEAPRKRERALLCPLCGMGLALAAAADGTASEQHVAACLRRRQERLAAQQAQHGGDVAAAAAALPEVQWLQLRRSQPER